MDYKIPIDYSQIYKDRVIVITGVGRSGTTQLGRILGSMENTCYIFEPAILKLLPLMFIGLDINSDAISRLKQTIRTVFFEDFCLPVLTGRNTNLNPKDWTYIHDYISEEQLRERCLLSSRQNAIKYIEKEKPYWVIKSPEALVSMLALDTIFDNIQYIHIIRDGLGVIESAVNKGWYTDEYMHERIVEWVGNTIARGIIQYANIPWYATEEEGILFEKYNPLTRAAYIWRRMAQSGMAYGIFNPEKYFEVRYEKMCSNPFEIASSLASRFGLKWTEIMERNIANTYKSKPVNEALVEQLQEPERSRFLTFREAIGYK